MALVLESIKTDQEQSLYDTLVKLQDVKLQLAGLKKMEKTLTAVIKRKMGADEVLVDGDGQNLATWKHSVRRTFDYKRFEEEHPETAQKYFVETKVRTFKLK